MLALYIVASPLTFAQNTNIQTDVTLSAYPDTIEGLRAFLRNYINAIKDAELDKRARMDRGLRIPEPDRWFAATFGPKLGHDRAATYIARPPRLYLILDPLDLGPSTQIHITHVEVPHERAAKLSKLPLLAVMTHPISYYSVYLSNDKRGTLAVYPVFVYVDHAFRLIYREFGNIDENSKPSCGLQRPYRGRVDTIEESMQRISPPGPPVPLTLPREMPKDIQQYVKLLVFVACDGQVLETDYLSGPPELYGPAADTVKRWKYAQKTLNGLPVETVSMVTVQFAPAKEASR
jgi:hypothetical protein